jgi:hypothetical protein
MLKKLRIGTLRTLESYVLLVYYSVKEAYLVDCCCLNQPDCQHLIASTLTKFNLKPDVLTIWFVGSDCFILNLQCLKNKTLNLINNPELFPIPIISVTAGLVELLSDKKSLQLWKGLGSILSKIDLNSGILQLSIMEESDSLISSPMLAGWLLGYPCVYNSAEPACASQSGGSSSLSMISLLKTTIMAEINVVPQGSASSGTNKYKQIVRETEPYHLNVELMNLSVPEVILENNIRLKEKFNNDMNGVKIQLDERLKELPVVRVLEVSKVTLQYTTCEVPAIVL